MLVKVHLIGLGNIGIGYDLEGDMLISRQTKSHAKAILESPDFELAGISDKSIKRFNTAQKILGTRNFQSKSMLTENSTSDLVVVAVNTIQHATVVESLTTPPKVLIIEKPAGSNSTECLRISSWAEQNSVQVFVNYFRRYLTCSINSRLYLSELETVVLLSAEIYGY